MNNIFNIKLGKMDLFSLVKFVKRQKKGEFHDWGLGVDCCNFYSSPFSIRNNCVTLVGFQEVLAEDTAICYSIVQKKWWGKRAVYGVKKLVGNYQKPDCFKMTMKDIPNGENYQIEIYNNFHIACGQFMLEEKDI